MSETKKFCPTKFLAPLFAGIGCALVVAGYYETRTSGTQTAASEPVTQTVPTVPQTVAPIASTKMLPIVVCSKAVRKGTILTRENLAYKEYEEQYLPTHGFSDELMVIGRPVLLDKGAGEMIFLEDVITHEALTAGGRRMRKMANEPVKKKD